MVKDTPSSKGALSDEELVRLAKAGRPEALDELVSRHYASAFRVALGILRDEDGAADVAQDAFLKAFRGLKTFRGEASFRTWLLTIAANEARGVLRKAARRKESDLDSAGPMAAEEADAENLLEIAEESERVRALLTLLPEKQREAVTLRVFEGMSFKEVGAVIGSSEGAARVNFHHGIRRLRELMG
jgi:RNA polymerase sigma-70 factor (ECF subfamily)